jgi:hypothetical protein
MRLSRALTTAALVASLFTLGLPAAEASSALGPAAAQPSAPRDSEDWIDLDPFSVATGDDVPDVSIRRAMKVCVSDWFDAASQSAINRAYRSLHVPRYADFVRVGRVTSTGIRLVFDYGEGDVSKSFAIGRVISSLARALTYGRTLQLWDDIGDSHLSCLRAALWLDEDSGVVAGQWARTIYFEDPDTGDVVEVPGYGVPEDYAQQR